MISAERVPCKILPYEYNMGSRRLVAQFVSWQGLLLPGFRHYCATSLVDQFTYRNSAGSIEWGRKRLLAVRLLYFGLPVMPWALSPIIKEIGYSQVCPFCKVVWIFDIGDSLTPSHWLGYALAKYSYQNLYRCYSRDLNLIPQALKAIALPTELRDHPFTIWEVDPWSINIKSCFLRTVGNSAHCVQLSKQ